MLCKYLGWFTKREHEESHHGRLNVKAEGEWKDVGLVAAVAWENNSIMFNIIFTISSILCDFVYLGLYMHLIASTPATLDLWIA